MAVLFAPPALATSSAYFESDSLTLLFEVGHDENPVIASVNLSYLESEGVWVRSPYLKITHSDFEAQRLELDYTNPGDAGLPPSFHLSVKGEIGVVQFNGKVEKGMFRWNEL